MNAKEAKQIPLKKILEQLGYKPAKETNEELWYYSPFRNEKEPSFKINPPRNIWYDFGEGFGGNVLDFIMILYDIADISTALTELERIGHVGQIRQSSFYPLQVTSGKGTLKQRQIEKIQPLQNRALIQYLQKRCISRSSAAAYVKEIYYSLKGREYFALAFPNLSGGYELRNPYFKGVIGKKDISLLLKRKGGFQREFTAVTLFEGFIDFLSALTFYKTFEAKTPVIVLNSVSTKDRATLKIKEMGATKVYLYLDRDKSGRRLSEYFRHQFGNSIQDKSDLYAGYKDFNEFLVKKS